MKIRYYYNRDEAKRPVETVCLFIHGQDITRGIAKCNLELDSISKKRGRRIARGRAMKAMKEGFDLRRFDSNFIRGYFNPELTDFEKRLVG